MGFTFRFVSQTVDMGVDKTYLGVPLGKSEPNPLYPDIGQYGSLSKLMDRCFEEIGSELRTESLTGMGTFWARVEGKSGHSQLCTAAQKRLFHMDYWQQGVNMLNGWTDSPLTLAQALDETLSLEGGIKAALEKHSWLEPTERVNAFAQGSDIYVQQAWDAIERRTNAMKEEHPSSHALALAVPEARAHPRLGVLFPFTSLFSLQFSSCTGYPFATPCSGIWASTENGQPSYKVRGWGINKSIEFEGDLKSVIEFIVAQLPPDCGPARHGTADDLKEK